jgi:2-aminoadipate transaminase
MDYPERSFQAMPLNISNTLYQAALPLADRAANLVGSVIDSSTSLLAAQTHDIVRFAMGSPADEAVPLAEFRDIADKVIDHSSMTYGATEGEPVLLTALVDYLAGTSDPTSPERVTITSGGMQGLDLACS